MMGRRIIVIGIIHEKGRVDFVVDLVVLFSLSLAVPGSGILLLLPLGL